jgi:hypothetical protein
LDNLELKMKLKHMIPSMAINAAAKFGLPRVPIIELYGLFHLIKSLPLI